VTVPCNCYALRQASRRVSQFYDQLLAPSGLRATQFMVLLEVEKLGPISLLPLAKHMIMDRATIGHNIRPLEASGYLTLTVGEDRRSREVSLTKAGRKVLAGAKPLWRRAHAIFEAEIGPDEAAKLRTMLRRVAESELAVEEGQVDAARSAVSHRPTRLKETGACP
jgi:DNA-binding MarR family transcriptional regulator